MVYIYRYVPRGFLKSFSGSARESTSESSGWEESLFLCLVLFWIVWEVSSYLLCVGLESLYLDILCPVCPTFSVEVCPLSLDVFRECILIEWCGDSCDEIVDILQSYLSIRKDIRESRSEIGKFLAHIVSCLLIY